MWCYFIGAFWDDLIAAFQTISDVASSEKGKAKGLPLDARVASWRREMIAETRDKNVNDGRVAIEEVIKAAPNTLGPGQLRRLVLAHKILLSTYTQKSVVDEGNSRILAQLLRLLPDLSKAIAAHGLQDVESIGQAREFPSETLRGSQIEAMKQLEFSVFRVLEQPVSQFAKHFSLFYGQHLRQALFAEAGIKCRPRVLLFGPSGSGKSFLINYLSKSHSTIPVKIVQLTSLFSPYLGQTEANLRSLFTHVRCTALRNASPVWTPDPRLIF